MLRAVILSLLATILPVFASSSVLAAPPDAAPVPNAEMKAVLDQLATMGGKPIETLTAPEARNQPTPSDAVKALLTSKGRFADPPAVGRTEDRKLSLAGREVPVRIYTPRGKGPFPVIVYFHGGGWVIATIDTYDASARVLTRDVGAVVVSVEYRKAPENKFPAAHDDAIDAYQWVVAHANELQGDPTRIAVAGESAGGNLAAAVAVMARDRGITMPVHQLLVYPVAAHDFDTPSYLQNADAKPLNRAMMKWFFDKYLKTPEDARDPRITLALTPSLAGLPSATVITAQIDPLRSEGRAYAEALRKAGVSVEYKNYDGVAHEFFGMARAVAEAKRAEAQATKNLVKAFKQAARRPKPAAATASPTK